MKIYILVVKYKILERFYWASTWIMQHTAYELEYLKEKCWTHRDICCINQTYYMTPTLCSLEIQDIPWKKRYLKLYHVTRGQNDKFIENYADI